MFVKPMKIGNILAAIGIVLGFLGFICLPFWNLHELPYVVDPSYPKGSGWILLVQGGIFARPGIIIMAVGGFMYLLAKLLPKKYWDDAKSYSKRQKEKKFRTKKELKDKT
jgi:hypothetical protein